MALTNWGFIYTAADADPEHDIHIADTGSCRTILIGVHSPDQAGRVATRLVDEYEVQLIELCGGSGPVWAAKIIEAIDARVPVGTVGYGPEAVDAVHAIFS